MSILGTGYLYNWGYGISGANFIPSQITGNLFNNISVGENFSAAINVQNLVTTNDTSTINTIIEKPNSDFGVTIFSKNLSIPINNLNFYSSFSGNSGSFINGTGFVSGKDFLNKILLVTKANTNSVNNDIGVLSLGQTLGTGTGNYFYPQNTFLDIKKNNLNYDFNDSWTGYSGTFIKYKLSGFSGLDAGIVLNDVGGLNLGLTQQFNTYEINYGSSERFRSGFLVRQNINLRRLGTNAPQIEIKKSVSGKVWASYDAGKTNEFSNSGIEISAVTPDNEFGEGFSINNDGSLIAIGCKTIGSLNDASVGGFFIYTGDSKYGWNLHNKFKVPFSFIGGYAQFGDSLSVARTGNILAIGGIYSTGTVGGYAGAVSVFTGNNKSAWSRTSHIIGGYISGYLGQSASFSDDGNVLLVGSPGVTTDEGVAYRYTSTNNFQTLTSSAQLNYGTYAPDSYWGHHVALSPDGVISVVGGPGFFYFNGGVMIFSGTTRVQIITGQKNNFRFGNSVGINNDKSIIVIGSKAPLNIGEVYIYSGNLTNKWSLLQTLSGYHVADLFGESVSINKNNTIIVGAPGNDQKFGNGGAYYIYTQNSNRWALTQSGFANRASEGIGVKTAISNDKNIGVIGGYKGVNNRGGITIIPTKYSTKNVFAYAIELVDKVQLSDEQLIFINSNSNSDIFSGYSDLLSPELSQGFNSSFSTYSGYCFNSLQCPEAKDSELENKVICFTGSSIEGREYEIFISGIKKQYKDQLSNYIKQYDFASTSYLEDRPSLFSFFRIQTGSIIYNSFITGDTVNFNLYNYDYTGFYKQYHLGNNPIYPNTGFSLRYPNDFNSIDTLVNKLNSNLNNISYPVWYPYECLSGEASGIYITGGLMFFYKDTGILSGELNYNNIIKFRSLRNYASGFDINLNLVNRDVVIVNKAQKIKRGFSYLIPDVIELQALTGNRWIVLDRRSGIYNTLTGLESRLVPSSSDISLLGLENKILSISDIKPKPSGEEDLELQSTFQTGKFELIETFTQNLSLSSRVPEYCGNFGEVKFRDISIYHKYDWPSGTEGCPPQPPTPGGGGGEEESSQQDESLLTSGNKKLNLFLNIKRTGWMLEPTGIYLNCLTSPDYDPLKIQFFEYRIVGKNFRGLSSYYSESLIPTNEIYFANINLFSLKESEFDGIFSGESNCLIGSDYIANIEDYVKVPFSTNFSYSISGENRSGIYKVLNQPIVYTPTAQERNIKFINSSGKIVDNITGFISNTFTGISLVTHEYNDRYFYNPNTKEISFQKFLSGYIVGTGVLTGQAFAIKQNVVNQELVAGSRLSPQPQYKEITSNGIVNGLLLNQRYQMSGALGFYYLTGIVTGLSVSGYFNYITGVTGFANLLDSNNLPYYPFYTGLVQSSGIINFDFNKIINFDSVIINNFAITYHSDTGNYPSPSFFNNLNTLNNIINSNEITFECTSQIFNNTGLLLVASNLYALGDSGNSISTSSDGNGIFSLQSFLSGGKTFYPILTPTGIFSGTANGYVGATGFYNDIGSGLITGNINSFSGLREFSGVWNIKTGQNFTLDQLSFSGNKYIGSGNFDINNILFLNLTYNNILDVSNNNLDIIDLKIKDNNFINIYNEGNLPSGVTGELIFRITGIKNI